MSNAYYKINVTKRITKCLTGQTLFHCFQTQRFTERHAQSSSYQWNIFTQGSSFFQTKMMQNLPKNGWSIQGAEVANCSFKMLEDIASVLAIQKLASCKSSNISKTQTYFYYTRFFYLHLVLAKFNARNVYSTNQFKVQSPFNRFLFTRVVNLA